MDTSKEYILMCEKAAEVQELWEPKQNDFAFCDGAYAVYHVSSCIEVPIKALKKSTNYFWLPRQDQLQKILGTALRDLVMVFALNWMNYLDGYELSQEAKQFNSMEQLWLAFVMSEKYNKKWDGEAWVK